MKGVLQIVNKNPYWVFILATLQVYDFIKPFLASTNGTVNISQINWFQDLSQFTIVIVLFFVLKNYNNVSNELIEKNEVISKLTNTHLKVLFTQRAITYGIVHRVSTLFNATNTKRDKEKERAFIIDGMLQDFKNITSEEISKALEQIQHEPLHKSDD